MSKRRIYYICRNVGYGVEEGEAIGAWGQVDWAGKREFHQDNGPTLYLFPDEIDEDEGIDQ